MNNPLVVYLNLHLCSVRENRKQPYIKKAPTPVKNEFAASGKV